MKRIRNLALIIMMAVLALIHYPIQAEGEEPGTSVAEVIVQPVVLIDGMQHEEGFPGENDEYISYLTFGNITPSELTVNMSDGASCTGSFGDVWSFLAGYNISASCSDTQMEDALAGNPWGVGTHKAKITIGGSEWEYDVEVIPCPIEKIEVEPITVTEGTACEHTCWIDGEEKTYLEYDFYSQNITVTVTLANGEVISGPIDEVYNRVYEACNLMIFLQSSQREDYLAGNPWGVGTHKAVAVAKRRGHDPVKEWEFDVIIAPNPIVSVSARDMECYSGLSAYQSSGWDSERQQEVLWDRYNTYPTSITVETAENGSISGFFWDVYDQLQGLFGSVNYEIIDGQSFENQWGTGTYPVTLKLGGRSCNYNVSVLPSPIQSVSVEDFSMFEGNRQIRSEWNNGEELTWEYYDATPENITVVTAENGSISGSFWTVFSRLDQLFGSVSYHIIDGQAYNNQWDIGTYPATLKLGGISCDYNVTILAEPVQSVFAEDFLLLEGSQEDRYEWNEGAEIRWKCYDVTPKTVTVVTGKGTYSGTPNQVSLKLEEAYGNPIRYSVDSDQSRENLWGVGEHSATITFGTVSCTYSVTIKARSIKTNPDYAEKQYGTDYIALYDKYGKNITIADVIEDPDTGFAYIKLNNGNLHELGLDFLSKAMVYNTAPAGEYLTEDDVYAAWWRLYITRWNYLLPEIPLYSNEYYDFYNAKIKGVEEYPTNPYWNPARALIDWRSEKPGNDIILGRTTELSGKFRYPSFGKSSPGASDNDIFSLISGYATVANTKEGGYVWNETAVDKHEEKLNDDGTLTYTITIKKNLKFSDGSPITAKDYIAFSLANLSPVGANASGRTQTGNTIVGGKDYVAYTGPGSAAGKKELTGMRLIDDYTFSVTVPEDYASYFYRITYAAFNPSPAGMWLGEGVEIRDDGAGCYLSDAFYDKDGDNYRQAANIRFFCTDTSSANWSGYPFSGPYMVQSFDEAEGTAVLVKNPEFKGNYEGTVPSIEKITYKKIVSKTQLEDFKTGGLDVIAAITGGVATDEAMEYANTNPDKAVYTHYSRAGYGKLGFRCDYGPVQFREVRQAIAYCMDRTAFAGEYTGGYGGVVDGPYHAGSWMYRKAVSQGMMLNSYVTSLEKAVEVLEEAGWIYDKDGNPYSSGVRYKKIPAGKVSNADASYVSPDGEYETVRIGDDYYMPLVINWFGTSDNEFTDLLQTGFRTNPNVEAAGMKVYNRLGDFQPMLDELYQKAAYGYYAGTPMYNAFNFATGYTGAIYDCAFTMTINPAEYDSYSTYYLKDAADFLWTEEDYEPEVITPENEDLKNAADLTDENADVEMNVEKAESEPDAETREEIRNAVGKSGMEIVSSFDIAVYSFQTDENGNEISGTREAVTQLKTHVTLTFLTPNEAGKTYLVVRAHVNANGEPEFTLLATTDNGDGTVSVETDRFSMYYLVAVDAADRTPGDINGDGKVSGRDVLALLKHLTGADVEIVPGSLDINGDGKVGGRDVLLLLRYLTDNSIVIH